MKTLTINVPDSVNEAEARWEMARSLFANGSLTLEQAASLAELSPTYFTRRIEDINAGHFSLIHPHFRRETYAFDKQFDRKNFDELVEQLNVQEPLKDLLARLSE
jgi:hypothetical protein